MAIYRQACLAKSSKGIFCEMSKNTVTLLDRVLAIPLVVYFWWHEQRQKIARNTPKKDS